MTGAGGPATSACKTAGFSAGFSGGSEEPGGPRNEEWLGLPLEEVPEVRHLGDRGYPGSGVPGEILPGGDYEEWPGGPLAGVPEVRHLGDSGLPSSGVPGDLAGSDSSQARAVAPGLPSNNQIPPPQAGQRGGDAVQVSQPGGDVVQGSQPGGDVVQGGQPGGDAVHGSDNSDQRSDHSGSESGHSGRGSDGSGQGSGNSGQGSGDSGRRSDDSGRESGDSGHGSGDSAHRSSSGQGSGAARQGTDQENPREGQEGRAEDPRSAGESDSEARNEDSRAAGEGNSSSAIEKRRREGVSEERGKEKSEDDEDKAELDDEEKAELEAREAKNALGNIGGSELIEHPSIENVQDIVRGEQFYGATVLFLWLISSVWSTFFSDWRNNFMKSFFLEDLVGWLVGNQPTKSQIPLFQMMCRDRGMNKRRIYFRDPYISHGKRGIWGLVGYEWLSTNQRTKFSKKKDLIGFSLQPLKKVDHALEIQHKKSTMAQ